MPRKPHCETTSERIYREVSGPRNASTIRRVLIRKPQAKAPLTSILFILSSSSDTLSVRPIELVHHILCDSRRLLNAG
jgi:hypothetical protein